MLDVRRGYVIKEIDMGDLAVMKRSGTLTAIAVSSCVIIMLFDREHGVAAMAHAMLPGRVDPIRHGQGACRTDYVDEAVEVLLRQMLAQGAERSNIEAKLVGGANMFPHLAQPIPKQNIAAAKAKLRAEKICLVGEMVGGHIGRTVAFDVATGEVTVKCKF